MSNWERKSSYLLHELVKFKTYIEALREAQARKETIYVERDEQELEAPSPGPVLESDAGQQPV